MTPSVRLSIEPDASAVDIAAVRSGLRAFNVVRIGEPAEEPVQILLRDDTGAVVGGLGYRVFGTLEGYPPGYRQYHLAKRFDGEDQ